MTKLNDCIESIREIFVTKETFELRLSPIEKIVYGGVSVILLAALSGVLALVIRKAQ